jgi:hypothetical protein
MKVPLWLKIIIILAFLFSCLVAVTYIVTSIEYYKRDKQLKERFPSSINKEGGFSKGKEGVYVSIYKFSPRRFSP